MGLREPKYILKCSSSLPQDERISLLASFPFPLSKLYNHRVDIVSYLNNSLAMTTFHTSLPPNLPAKAMQELPQDHRWRPQRGVRPEVFYAPGPMAHPDDLAETEFEDDVEDAPEIISDDDEDSESDDDDNPSTPHPATFQHPAFPPTHRPMPIPSVQLQPDVQPQNSSPTAPLSPQVIQQIKQAVKNEGT